MRTPPHVSYTLAAALLGVAAVCSLPAGDAHAQTSLELGVRADLLHRAQIASSSGDNVHALGLALEALRIESSPALRLFIAERHRALRHPAQALVSAELCNREARSGANVSNRESIVRSCSTLIDQMRREVAFVRVRVPEPRPEGLALRLGGELIPDSLIGLPVPVEPGEVTVIAAAPGRETFSVTVRMSAGHERTVDAELRVSAGPVNDNANDPPPPVVTPAPPAAEPPREVAGRARRVPVGAVVVASAGAAGLIVGGALGGLYLGARGSFEQSWCNGPGALSCDPRGSDELDGVRGLALGANVSLVVGGLALGGGVAWGLVELLRGSPGPERVSAWACAPSGRGVQCETRF